MYSSKFNQVLAHILSQSPHLHALSVSDEQGHVLGYEPKAAQTSINTIQTFGHLTLKNRSTLLHAVHIQGSEGQWTGHRFSFDHSIFVLWIWWNTEISTVEIQSHIQQYIALIKAELDISDTQEYM